MSNKPDRRHEQSGSAQTASSPEVVSAASTYIVFAALSGLFVSLWFSPNDSIITILIATFLGLMFAVRFWTVGLLFLTVQVGLFLAEPHALWRVNYSPGSSLLAMAVLTLLISSCRYLGLTSSPLPYRMTNRESIIAAMQHVRRSSRESFARFGVLPRDELVISSAEMIMMLVRIVVPVTVVSVLLTLIPLNLRAPEYAGLMPTVLHIIMLGAVLLVSCVLANGLMNVLAWRYLSETESRVFLRTELSKWIHREVSAVSRHRIKRRASRRN